MNAIAGLFSKNWHFNIFFALLLLSAATLPFTTYLMLPIAMLMLLNWIIEWQWKNKWQHIIANKRGLALIIFTLICLTVIYGVTISYNKGHAKSYFDCYLWFFTAPIVMLPYVPTLLTKQRIRQTLGIFAAGTTIHILVLFCVALYRFILTGNHYFFFYGSFSLLYHPTYISMYATLAFYIVLYYLYNKRKALSTGLIIALTAVLALLFAGIICLSSKAAILVFGVLTILWFFYLLKTTKKRVIGGICLGIFALGLFLFMQKSDSYVLGRFHNTVKQLSQRHENPNSYNSTQIRLSTWKSSWEVAQNNLPWGVGTGDAIDELSLHAIQHNYKNLIGHRFNAHNQYLQNLLTTGIPGIIILLIYCFYPLVCGIKRHDILYSSFALILILNILVESMFEVRAGVDFIAITNVLLYLRSEPEHKLPMA